MSEHAPCCAPASYRHARPCTPLLLLLLLRPAPNPFLLHCPYCCLLSIAAQTPADLHSPDKGGHTAFPEAAATKAAMGSEHRAGVDPNEWYCHDDRVLSAAPPAGTGVLFW